MARKTTSTTKVKPRRTATGKAKSTVAELAPMPVVRQKRTIFRAGTLITVLLLLAMIELTVYLNQQKEKTGAGTATAVSEAAPIFNAEDGVVTSIEVKPMQGDIVKVVRDENNAWALELPTKTEADQAAAEAAATQVSALKVLSQIDAGKSPSIFGLDKPAYIITIEFKGGKHMLEVGDVTPSNSGYYVRVDKGNIVITDLSGIDALLQLGFFPPYLNTPTPASPTEAISTPTP